MNKQTQKQGFLRTIVNDAKAAVTALSIALGAAGCSTTPPVADTPKQTPPAKVLQVTSDETITFENDAAKAKFNGELEAHAQALGVSGFSTHIQAALAKKLDLNVDDILQQTETDGITSAPSIRTDLPNQVRHEKDSFRVQEQYASLVDIMLNDAPTNAKRAEILAKATQIYSNNANQLFVADGERTFGYHRMQALLAELATLHTDKTQTDITVDAVYTVKGKAKAKFQTEEQTLAGKLGALTAEQTANLASTFDGNKDFNLDDAEMQVTPEAIDALDETERQIKATYKFNVQKPYAKLFAKMIEATVAGKPTKARMAYEIANDTTITEEGFGPIRLAKLAEAIYKTN